MANRFGAQYVTAADIRKLEDAMNSEDVEVMVAAVDRIVGLRLKAAQATTPKQRVVVAR